MDKRAVLHAMKSKRPRDPGPPPERKAFESDDAWRAKTFGWWIQKHGLTLDGVAAASGVSRSAVISLSGGAGAAVTNTWSRIRRGTLLSLWEVVSLVDPLTLADMRDWLRIPRDHDPMTWADAGAVAGTQVAQVQISGQRLTVTWDVRDGAGPHVWRDGEALRIGDSLPDGAERYGRLVSITP